MRAAILSWAIVMVVGCGASQTEVLQKQLAELQQQLVEMRKVQAGMSVTVEDLETRMFLVQDQLDTRQNQRALAYDGPRDLPTVRIRPQSGPEAIFDPRADEPLAEAPANTGVLKFDELTPDGTLIRGSEAPPEEAPVRAAAPATPPKPALPQAERDAVRLYKDSYDQVKLKHYEDAISGFDEFIQRFPTHGYADNALYWKAECFYDRALWVKAAETFQQVIQSYPLGNKAPDAMLKLGLCHFQLKNLRQAREVLEQVRDIYPNTPIAMIARERLEQIP